MKRILIALGIFITFIVMMTPESNVAQRLVQFSMEGSIEKTDTAGTGSGNKFQKGDTLKVPLKEIAFSNKYQVLIKLTDTTSADGKLPSVGIDWGYLKTDRTVIVEQMPIIAIPGSSAGNYSYHLVDSIDAFNVWVHFAIDSIDDNEGIFLVVFNSDDDTSQVPYDRAFNYELITNIR